MWIVEPHGDDALLSCSRILHRAEGIVTVVATPGNSGAETYSLCEELGLQWIHLGVTGGFEYPLLERMEDRGNTISADRMVQALARIGGRPVVGLCGHGHPQHEQVARCLAAMGTLGQIDVVGWSADFPYYLERPGGLTRPIVNGKTYQGPIMTRCATQKWELFGKHYKTQGGPERFSERKAKHEVETYWLDQGLREELEW